MGAIKNGKSTQIIPICLMKTMLKKHSSLNLFHYHSSLPTGPQNTTTISSTCFYSSFPFLRFINLIYSVNLKNYPKSHKSHKSSTSMHCRRINSFPILLLKFQINFYISNKFQIIITELISSLLLFSLLLPLSSSTLSRFPIV